LVPARDLPLFWRLLQALSLGFSAQASSGNLFVEPDYDFLAKLEALKRA